ncbi:MAG: hypothetical protein AAFY26_27905, partial [Cyanobacteria bacterium J06638_22]
GSGTQVSPSEADKEVIASPEGMHAAPNVGLQTERDRSLSRLRQRRNQLRQTLSSDGSIPPLQVDTVQQERASGATGCGADVNG